MDKQQNCPLDRRRFLAALGACGAAALVPGHFSAQQTAITANSVAEIFFDIHRIRKWDNSNGDTWDPFWADDDNLYAFNCDGRGFGADKKMNLAFNKLSGNAPSTLFGTQVNQMDEYGKGGQKGPDNATWKACGQECIDGIFYAFVSRNVYGSDGGDPLTRQLALNSSLIKSTDRGRTWSRSAQENYDRPMWPGRRFATPFFVHYGRNGGQIHRDGADDHVYACSTNGFWNDGDSLVLGRVKRSHLPNLDSADWEYYTGADGSASASWSPHLELASPILNRPAKCGQTPITYVPDLDIYLLISWYNTARMTKWFAPNEMRYDFYQAPHPWGPWSAVTSFSDRFLGPNYHMYGPSLCARFQQRKGADVEISLFTSGCPFTDLPGTPYKIWHIPVLLRTTPLPTPVLVPAADKQIRYHGAWFPWTTVADAEEDRLPRASQTKGSTAELTFYGTGIEYLAQKCFGEGDVEIYLDQQQQDSTSLNLADFPVFFGVTVFSRHQLPRAQHVIKILNSSDSRINLEAFKVYP